MPLEVGLQILQHKSLATKLHCISQSCELLWTKPETLCNSHHRSDNNSIVFQQLKVHSRNRERAAWSASGSTASSSRDEKHRDIHLCPADVTGDDTAQQAGQEHLAKLALRSAFPGLGHRGIYTCWWLTPLCLRKAVTSSNGADYFKKLHLSVSQSSPKTVNLRSQLPQHK